MSEENFEYTYSATEDKELQKIKDKYKSKTPKETKIQQLKSLDKSVTKNATIVAITFGIIGILLFGVGITFVTTFSNYFIIGIIVGVLGMIIMSVSYPIYCKIVKNKRNALAPVILKLIDDIEKDK